MIAPGRSHQADRRAEQTFELITYARGISSRLPGGWDRRARELGKAVVNYRGARRAYARRALFSLLGLGSDVLLAPFGRARLLVPADDQEIGRVVFATGGYERVYMACAVEELRRLGFRVEGTTFVDVGANIGTSTIDALVDFGFGRAVCFEPDERSYRLLLANLALNGLDGKALVYPVALSADERLSLLHLSATNRADNRLLAEGELLEAKGPDVVSVECRRFDAFVAERLFTLDEIGVIWLDAQGHEPFVLQGAFTALEAGIPLVVEYTPGALRAHDGVSALEAMISAHYTTVIDLHLLAAGLRRRAVIDASEVARLREIGDREHTDLLVVRLPAPRS